MSFFWVRQSRTQLVVGPLIESSISAGELEAAGLLTRTVHPVVPPHVDYAITELVRTALPAIETLRTWGASYRAARAG